MPLHGSEFFAMLSILKRFLVATPEPRRRTDQSRRPVFQPSFECLEDRVTPVTAVTNLTALTPQDLVQNLVGQGVTFSNVSYTGSNLAAGIFQGGANSIGMDTGVVLSSGRANAVVGPNSLINVSNSNLSPGDADLDLLVAPDQTFDAAVLEFDFVPQGGSIVFTYVFSSDEYLEFVGGSFNDVFAFYLNGQNAALLPGTSTFVSINNVNNTTNSQFFVDNSTPPFPRNTSMDGFTTVLTLILPVNAGQSNHIKIAVADVFDRIVDTNVFIQAGSFASPNIKALNPIRYTPNDATNTYDGYVTLTNAGTGGLSGPLFVSFSNLPTGVTLTNASGVDSNGVPFITLNSGLAPQQTERIFVQYSNPNNVILPSYYAGANLQFSNVPPGTVTATGGLTPVFAAASAPASPAVLAQLPTQVAFSTATSDGEALLTQDGIPLYQSPTFDGFVTVFNNQPGDITANVRLTFPPLPAGVTLLDATGVLASGAPEMVISNAVLKASRTTRFGFELLNPNLVDLENYFGNFPIQVTLS